MGTFVNATMYPYSAQQQKKGLRFKKKKFGNLLNWNKFHVARNL
jgi:hypothetical protein